MVGSGDLQAYRSQAALSSAVGIGRQRRLAALLEPARFDIGGIGQQSGHRRRTSGVSGPLQPGFGALL